MRYLFLLLLLPLAVQAKDFVDEQITVTESVVNFSQNKSKVVKNAVKKLKELPNGEVTIIGYASSEGEAEANMALSKRRAVGVSKFLSRDASVSWVGDTQANPLMDYRDRKVIIQVTSSNLVYNPIFDVNGILQGVISHQLYNVVPIR